jgi:translation elongation factor P/translation initiation factor 5A
MLRTTTHTKTGNNTGSFETRTNNTTTHTKLKITFEASELKSVTLKERKLEIILILEEQIQLVLTRVRDKVSRSSIYTAKILLETPILES